MAKVNRLQVHARPGKAFPAPKVQKAGQAGQVEHPDPCLLTRIRPIIRLALVPGSLDPDPVLAKVPPIPPDRSQQHMDPETSRPIARKRHHHLQQLG